MKPHTARGKWTRAGYLDPDTWWPRASMLQQPVRSTTSETMILRKEEYYCSPFIIKSCIIIHWVLLSNYHKDVFGGRWLSWSAKRTQGEKRGNCKGHFGLGYKEKLLSCAVQAQVQPDAQLLNKALGGQLARQAESGVRRVGIRVWAWDSAVLAQIPLPALQKLLASLRLSFFIGNPGDNNEMR